MTNIAMVKGRKETPRGYVRVSLKRASHDRFWQLAKSEGKSLSGFLDDVSVFMAGSGNAQMIPETPQQQVMNRMAGFQRTLDGLARDVDRIMTYLVDLEREKQIKASAFVNVPAKRRKGGGK